MASFDEDAYRAQIQRSKGEFAEEESDPLGLHRWVRLVNLSATAMNGKLAEVLFPLNADTGRVGVRLAGEALASNSRAGKSVAIKPANLKPLSDQKRRWGGPEALQALPQGPDDTLAEGAARGRSLRTG